MDLSGCPRYTDPQKLVWRYSVLDDSRLHYSFKTRFRFELVDEVDNTSVHLASIKTNTSQRPRSASTPKQLQLHLLSVSQVLESFVDIKIPLALSINETFIHEGPLVSISKLIQLFQERTFFIYNCLLYEKKIVMVGHNKNAGEVASYVLSVCSMTPELPNLLRSRVFPYISLANMDFTKVPGYVIGATNPMFASKEDFYDIVCDLDNGNIQLSTTVQMNITKNQMFNQPAINLQKRRGTVDFPPTPKLTGAEVLQLNLRSKSLHFKPTVIKKHYRTASRDADEPSSPDIRRMSSMRSPSVGYLDHDTGMLIFDYGGDDVSYLTDSDVLLFQKISQAVKDSIRRTKEFCNQDVDGVLCGLWRDYTEELCEVAFDQQQQILFHQQQYYKSISSTSSPSAQVTSSTDPSMQSNVKSKCFKDFRMAKDL
ncbi:hypothetical protein AKO1_011908 [Acrasis kona]|uniref:UDENN domain-containing protein n=1 Tax=Acrasis kona TaxID=1008807 RepID=A0AAW2Z8E7_9EUKA